MRTGIVFLSVITLFFSCAKENASKPKDNLIDVSIEKMRRASVYPLLIDYYFGETNACAEGSVYFDDSASYAIERYVIGDRQVSVYRPPLKKRYILAFSKDLHPTFDNASYRIDLFSDVTRSPRLLDSFEFVVGNAYILPDATFTLIPLAGNDAPLYAFAYTLKAVTSFISTVNYREQWRTIFDIKKGALMPLLHLYDSGWLARYEVNENTFEYRESEIIVSKIEKNDAVIRVSYIVSNYSGFFEAKNDRLKNVYYVTNVFSFDRKKRLFVPLQEAKDDVIRSRPHSPLVLGPVSEEQIPMMELWLPSLEAAFPRK